MPLESGKSKETIRRNISELIGLPLGGAMFFSLADFKFLMFGIAKHHEVFNAVIQGVAVYMMDMFLCFKFSSNMVFHNKPMKPISLSIDSNSFILMRFIPGFFEPIFRKLGKVDFSQARSRAVFGCFGSILWKIKFFAARQTLFSFTEPFAFKFSVISDILTDIRTKFSSYSSRMENFRTGLTGLWFHGQNISNYDSYCYV